MSVVINPLVPVVASIDESRAMYKLQETCGTCVYMATVPTPSHPTLGFLNPT